MEDRIVQNPHRYQLAPVSGQSGVYDLAPIPGKITAVGTQLNKATLFSDTTAALFGLSGVNATPDKGFQAAHTKINQVNTNLTNSINSVAGRATVLEGTAWKKMGTISLPIASYKADIAVPAGTREMMLTSFCNRSIVHNLRLMFNDIRSANVYGYIAIVQTGSALAPELVAKRSSTLFDGLNTSAPSVMIYLYNLDTAAPAALATFMRGTGVDSSVITAGNLSDRIITAVNKITVEKSDTKNIEYIFNVWRR